uniref:ATP synthase subunit b n=1 Tax=Amphilophus citrinellus TaxID=61819 RepID=A0A3Q0R8Y7_AMPCI
MCFPHFIRQDEIHIQLEGSVNLCLCTQCPLEGVFTQTTPQARALLYSRVVSRGFLACPPSLRVVHASRCLHTSSQSLAPVPPLPEKGGKVRHGIIPEELFQLLYPKTGVTGVKTNLILFLSELISYLSQSIQSKLISLGSGDKLMCFPHFIRQDGVRTEHTERPSYNTGIQEFHIKVTCLLSSCQNNVAMLLETNYRERLHMVTNEVKRRLDYQIALQDLHRRMEQEHMINWVEKSVVSSITPQQEKESIAKCITDLKALAKTTQAKATA